MLYNTITIRKSPSIGHYIVSVKRDNVDRIENASNFNAGNEHAHVEVTYDMNEAVAKLADQMIEMRKKLIEEMKNEINDIQAAVLKYQNGR